MTVSNITDAFRENAAQQERQRDDGFTGAILIAQKGGQYIVHENTGLLKLSNDVVFYGEEKYREKYGNQRLRTLAEFRAELASIPDRRIAVADEGIAMYNQALKDSKGKIKESPIDMGNTMPRGRYAFYAEAELFERLKEFKLPTGVHNAIDAKGVQSRDLGEKEDYMRNRLAEMLRDMKDHGVADPQASRPRPPSGPGL